MKFILNNLSGVNLCSNDVMQLCLTSNDNFILPNRHMKSLWIIVSRFFIYSGKVQVSHSQCSLRENPKFLQNFKPKITHMKDIFDFNFHLISTIVFLAWHSKVKKTIILYQPQTYVYIYFFFSVYSPIIKHTLVFC
jgi:hypothetical protein